MIRKYFNTFSLKKILCLALVVFALGFTAFNIAAKATSPTNEMACWIL